MMTLETWSKILPVAESGTNDHSILTDQEPSLMRDWRIKVVIQMTEEEWLESVSTTAISRTSLRTV